MDELEPLPDWFDYEMSDFERIVEENDWATEWTSAQDLALIAWKANNPGKPVEDMTKAEAIAIVEAR